MGRIFAHWMHGNMPIWENFEGRWIFQVTLIKKQNKVNLNSASIQPLNDEFVII